MSQLSERLPQGIPGSVTIKHDTVQSSAMSKDRSFRARVDLRCKGDILDDTRRRAESNKQSFYMLLTRE